MGKETNLWNSSQGNEDHKQAEASRASCSEEELGGSNFPMVSVDGAKEPRDESRINDSSHAHEEGGDKMGMIQMLEKDVNDNHVMGENIEKVVRNVKEVRGWSNLMQLTQLGWKMIYELKRY